MIQAQFKAGHLIQALDQLRIERTSLQCPAGEQECFRTAVHPYAGRAVRTAHGRNPELFKPFAYSAERRCRTGRDAPAAHALPAEHRDQFLIGQLRDELLHRDLSFKNVFQLISPVSGIWYLSGNIPADLCTFKRCLFIAEAYLSVSDLRPHPVKRPHRSAALLQTLKHLMILIEFSCICRVPYIAAGIDPVNARFKHIAGFISRLSRIII